MPHTLRCNAKTSLGEVCDAAYTWQTWGTDRCSDICTATLGRYQTMGPYGLKPQKYLIGDYDTALVWEQTPSSTVAVANIDDANKVCSLLGTAMRDASFRLPTLKELQTLLKGVDARCSPTIDGVAFDITAVPFWSSTASGSLFTGGYLGVNFAGGGTVTLGAIKAPVSGLVLCVRDSREF